jgi:TonB family protein
MHPAPRRTTFLIFLFALGFVTESGAQRSPECDSAMFVSDKLQDMVDVRAQWEGWAAPNTSFHVLLDQPKARNRMDVARFLVQNYPPFLRERRIGGEVLLAVLVDTIGIVKDRRILRTSGFLDFDRAALEAARLLRYDPFRLEAGCAVRTVLHMPMVFQIR